MDFPSSFVAPIYVTPSSTSIPTLDPCSPSSMGYHFECLKDTSVVSTTTLHVRA